MRRTKERNGEGDFREGLRGLRDHRPDAAVRSLRASVEACPAARTGELARRLYWFAVALLRLDKPELALKSLASAQKLRPRSVAREAYRARVNDYGMPKRPNRELDDFYAFYSIRTCAYLGMKERPRFDSVQEKDLVVRLVGDAWLSLTKHGRLAGKTASEKLELYRDWPIAFPAFGLNRPGYGKVLPADFRNKKALHGEERCSCGSGLPYRQCCGRTASPRELSCE
jgi:hypothetical protein